MGQGWRRRHRTARCASARDRDDCLQHVPPAVGTVDVAGPQRAAFRVAELVYHEQRVTAGAAEGVLVSRAFLLATGRVHRRVDIENDHLRRAAAVYAVDTETWKLGERYEIVQGAQPLRLEASHLAGRGRQSLEAVPIDDGTHRGVDQMPVGVVDILVAGEAAVDRVPQQAGQQMLLVLSPALIRQRGPGSFGQAENLIQLSVCKQSGIGGDLVAVEIELRAPFEFEPENVIVEFTRWKFHGRPAFSITGARPRAICF